jgi:hypothetical protein
VSTSGDRVLQAEGIDRRHLEDRPDCLDRRQAFEIEGAPRVFSRFRRRPPSRRASAATSSLPGACQKQNGTSFIGVAPHGLPPG